VPVEYSYGVGINDEASMPARIEEHAVRRLRPYAGDREQAFSHGGSLAGK
jgi:hypothetical protein